MWSRTICFAWAICFSSFAIAGNFGYQGQSGQNGWDGRNGKGGRAAVVHATGQSESYDLTGSRGEDGGNGSYGSNAGSCYFPQANPAQNMHGASGGDGGCGGNGGRGGNGGALTVYYEDISNLSLMHVDGRPGRGGRGGHGAQGGSGCYCPMGSWQAKVGEQTQTFHCSNGQNGMYGNRGYDGSNGGYGQVVLISQLEPLPKEKHNAQFVMPKMEEQDIKLSKNLWVKKTGAASLFAAGSYLSNTFYQFVETVGYHYRFKWEAPRPITDFNGYSVSMYFNNKNEIDWNHPSGLWHDGEETVDENGDRTYTFTAAVKYSEVNRFAFKEALNSKKDLTVVVKDNSGVASSIKNEVRVRYLTRNGHYYYARFDGDVPAELVTQNGDEIHVNIGGLEIEDKYLDPGLQAWAYVYLKRIVGHHSGTWYVNRTFTIPKPDPEPEPEPESLSIL